MRIRIKGHDRDNHERYAEGIGECASYVFRQIPKYVGALLIGVPIRIAEGVSRITRAVRRNMPHPLTSLVDARADLNDTSDITIRGLGGDK